MTEGTSRDYAWAFQQLLVQKGATDQGSKRYQAAIRVVLPKIEMFMKLHQFSRLAGSVLSKKAGSRRSARNAIAKLSRCAATNTIHDVLSSKTTPQKSAVCSLGVNVGLTTTPSPLQRPAVKAKQPSTLEDPFSSKPVHEAHMLSDMQSQCCSGEGELSNGLTLKQDEELWQHVWNHTWIASETAADVFE